MKKSLVRIPLAIVSTALLTFTTTNLKAQTPATRRQTISELSWLAGDWQTAAGSITNRRALDLSRRWVNARAESHRCRGTDLQFEYLRIDKEKTASTSRIPRLVARELILR